MWQQRTNMNKNCNDVCCTVAQVKAWERTLTLISFRDVTPNQNTLKPQCASTRSQKQHKLDADIMLTSALDSNIHTY